MALTLACFLLLLLAVQGLQLKSGLNARVSTKTFMAGGQVPYVPYYPSKSSKDYQWMDIYNALGRERTLFVSRYLDNESCNQLIASLIWLQGQSETDPITMYFNVPGAMSKPSLAVFDVMSRMKCPIITVNTGLTVGMGALLCAAGTRGKRFAMPNARFLMSRSGMDDGIEGQAVDIHLQVMEVVKDNKRATRELARLCGLPLDKLESDLKRDFYLTAAEASQYGVVDQVMLPAQPIKMMQYRGSDDDVVGFGHFSEVRKVKAGPADVVVTPTEEKEQDYDAYAAKEMAKKGFNNGRPDPRSLKNGGGVNRFANSRCKPPGAGKPPTPRTGGGGGGTDEFDKNPFKNTDGTTSELSPVVAQPIDIRTLKLEVLKNAFCVAIFAGLGGYSLASSSQQHNTVISTIFYIITALGLMFFIPRLAFSAFKFLDSSSKPQYAEMDEEEVYGV